MPPNVNDPYYCAGAVKKNLASVGFPNVINRNEDCYGSDFWIAESAGSVPMFDVIVTNPPFSEKPVNHIDRLFKFALQRKKPVCSLMPTYVSVKPFFQSLFDFSSGTSSPPDDLKALSLPLLLCPRKRYFYFRPRWAVQASEQSPVGHGQANVTGTSPHPLRKKGSGLVGGNSRRGTASTGNPITQDKQGKLSTHKTSPFVTAWYIWPQPVMSRRKLLRRARKRGWTSVSVGAETEEGGGGEGDENMAGKDWLLVQRLLDLPHQGWAGGGGKY